MWLIPTPDPRIANPDLSPAEEEDFLRRQAEIPIPPDQREDFHRELLRAGYQLAES